MKHLAVALIVIALIAADFGSDLWMDDTTDNSAALYLSIIWFWYHRDRYPKPWEK